MCEIIRADYPDVEVLMGTSTAGIAHAAIVGHMMGLPMGYVRSSSKDHGRQNQIEGRLEPGQKVVVIEDLISTGGSVLDVVNVLREAGAEVLGVASIFTYGMQKGLDRLAAASVKNHSLTNFDEMCIRDRDHGTYTLTKVTFTVTCLAAAKHMAPLLADESRVFEGGDVRVRNNPLFTFYYITYITSIKVFSTLHILH